MSNSFALSQTALASLRAIVGADKGARHDLIVQHVGTIAALALAKEAPKGYGNPGDHTKVSKAFEDGGMQRYSDACVGLSVALKQKGFRSIESWEEAEQEGTAMAVAMFDALKPKLLTKAQKAAKEEAKAKKAATREAEAKAAEQATKDAHAAELQAAEERGRASVQAPQVTAQMVADLIKTGAFDSEGLALIADALQTTPVGATATA